MVLDVSGHDAERVVDWLNFYNKYEGGRASRVGNRATTIVKPRKIKIQGGCMSLFLHNHSMTSISPDHGNIICHSKPYYCFNFMF